ncbi:MAG: outer membrane protein assembly factor BamB family protein [Acidobacteriota bacterium]
MMPRRSSVAILLAVLFTVAALYTSAQAPPARDVAQEPQLGGGKPIFPSNQGGPNFQQHCASCHTAEGMNMGGRVVPSVTALRTLTAEQVYAAITTGSMVQQASSLSDPQKRELAGFVSGKRFTDTSSYSVEKMTNRCSTNPTLGELAAAPAWNGWSPTPNNTRFQPGATAGITAADVPKLKLKWAFGLPGGASGTSQPTVGLGRVFVGSDNGFLYSLDAKSGCGYWSFRPEGADAAGPYAPMVGPISGFEGTKYAVFIVARGPTAFAVDAQSGKELWRSRIAGGGGMRGSPTLAGGRIYVPITGSETMVGEKGTCCRTRGAVVSIDANNGQIVWRADTIQEPLTQIGAKKDGTPVMGPSGASVWNAPTVDLKRRRVYVGTGNSFGPVAASTSDSIMAFNIDDGKIVWHHQEFKDDAFMLNCPDRNPDGGNCPPVLGPDWDFGGASVILQTLSTGQDVLLAAGKGGIAIALNANDGKVLWRTKLYDATSPTADGLVLFGGTSDGARVYYPLQQPKGGLAAVQIANGKLDWNVKLDGDGRGQFGPASGIPGVVFTGAWDGVLRAIDASGKTVWRHNSRQPYKTVNGVFADGGSFGSAGPTIANGMVYVVSGYIGMQAGSPGNVLLAFGIE